MRDVWIMGPLDLIVIREDVNKTYLCGRQMLLLMRQNITELLPEDRPDSLRRELQG